MARSTGYRMNRHLFDYVMNSVNLSAPEGQERQLEAVHHVFLIRAMVGKFQPENEIDRDIVELLATVSAKTDAEEGQETENG